MAFSHWPAFFLLRPCDPGDGGRTKLFTTHSRLSYPLKSDFQLCSLYVGQAAWALLWCSLSDPWGCNKSLPFLHFLLILFKPIFSAFASSCFIYQTDPTLSSKVSSYKLLYRKRSLLSFFYLTDMRNYLFSIFFLMFLTTQTSRKMLNMLIICILAVIFIRALPSCNNGIHA